MNEFDVIEKLLTPLAKESGALGLKDDAALLHVPLDSELVVTKDALVEGVHFTGNEPAQLIAQKLLRVNLSDLAAMGAKPWGYFLALMLPPKITTAWLADFAEGLKRDQAHYGITLMGGDTTRTPGTLAFSVTAMGLVPKGQGLKRSGAQVGDAIYVSGTLGDAALGLKIAKGEVQNNAFLLKRYQLPDPRVKLGQMLFGIATACMDISDGLMQDLGHICAASHVGAEIYWPFMPLSDAAKEAQASAQLILSGGDDYELLFTISPHLEEELISAAKATNTPITRIGKIIKGSAVTALDENNHEIRLQTLGYQHF